MSRTILILLLPGLLLLTVACGDDGPRIGESDGVFTQAYEFTDFTVIQVRDGFSVEIERSDDYRVTVSADERLVDVLAISNDDGVLRLALGTGSNDGSATLEAKIELPLVERIELSGASRLKIDGYEATGEVLLDLSGASSVEGRLEVTTANFDLSGASTIDLEGSSDVLVLEASGSSMLELADFDAITSQLNLSGGSMATVNVSDVIDPVNLSGGSVLRYIGDPAVENVHATGGSTYEQVED